MKRTIFILLLLRASFQPSEGTEFTFRTPEGLYKAKVTEDANTHKGTMNIITTSLKLCYDIKSYFAEKRHGSKDPKNNANNTFLTVTITNVQKPNYRNVYGVTDLRCSEESAQKSHFSFSYAWISGEDGQSHVYSLFIEGTKEFLCYATVDDTSRKIVVNRQYEGLHKSPSGVIQALDTIYSNIKKRSKVEGNQFVLGGPLRKGAPLLLFDQLQRHYVIGFKAEDNDDGEEHLSYSYEKMESYLHMYTVIYSGRPQTMDGVFNEEGGEWSLVISQANYVTSKEALKTTGEYLQRLIDDKVASLHIRGPWITRPNIEEGNSIKLDFKEVMYEVDENDDARLILRSSKSPA